MQWADVSKLNGLWLVLGLAIVFIWSWSLWQRRWEGLADPGLLPKGLRSRARRALIGKAVLICSAFVLSLVALARPQWGYEWQDIKRQGVNVLVVFDTSRSMLTQDVRPNRFERARLGVLDLVAQLKGDRIGLVAFAGDAFLMCPLTSDYAGFRLSLDDLNVDTIPRGGTNIARGIQTALEAAQAEKQGRTVIILITDGDVLEGDVLKAARDAQKDDVTIYTVGVGTPEGELIQVTDRQGQKSFLRDDSGNVVKSRLSESVLQQIAVLTGGTYMRAGSARFGIDALYMNQIAVLDKHEFDARREKKYYERFQIPLALALVLLVVQTCLFSKN